MKISQTDKNSLRVWFTDALEHAFLTQFSCHIDHNKLEAPAISPEADKYFSKHLGRRGLAGFIEHELFSIIALSATNLTEDYQRVSDVSDIPDIASLAKKLLETLSEIPRSYSIIMRAPAALGKMTKSLKIDYEISDRLKIVSSDILTKKVIFDYENQYLNDRLWRHNKIEVKSLSSDFLYFTYSTSGFVSIDQPKIFQDFMNEIRSFYGACLAHEILWAFNDQRHYQQVPIIMCADFDSGKIVQVISCDTDIYGATYFYPGLDRVRFNKVSSFHKSMSPVKKFLSCKSEKLKTAAIWYLRALTSTRSLDQVLESAITLEVLLGDQQMSDRVGLTKLMANRFAYALGESAADREAILEKFIRFYRLRSEIVHSGRIAHGSDDEDLVHWGIDISGKLLVHEQKLANCE